MSSRPTYAPPARVPAAPQKNKRPAILADIDYAVRTNNLQRAVGLAHKALDAGLADPVLFTLRAQWRKHNGRAADAIADLERVLAFDPRSAAILSEIADCLNGLGHHKKALTAADEALSADPEFAKAWYQKALAHQMLNQLDEAKEAYLAAVRCDGNLVDALARLAGMAVQEREHDKARAYARRALALNPTQDVALLAQIALDMAEDRQQAAEAGIQSVLSNPKVPTLTCAIALSHLGDLRDRQGRAAEAFDAYSEAGESWHAVYGPRFERPEQETVPQMLERLTQAAESAPASAWHAVGTPTHANDSAGVAFILGHPRSGTTLLGQILDSRPDVALIEEKPLLALAIADFVTAKDGPAKLAGLSDRALEPYREDFWQRARSQHGIDTRGKLVVEQTAFNTVHLSVIRRLFPDAPVVFALRDPRDVVFSCFRRLFAPNLFTLPFHSLEPAARLYDAIMRHAEAHREHFGFQPLVLRNEDLIAEFDLVTQNLCRHLGLEWDDAMRDYHRAAPSRVLTTRSATQVRRGISSDGIGQWRRYREQMAPVLPLLAPWVERFGYDAD